MRGQMAFYRPKTDPSPFWVSYLVTPNATKRGEDISTVMQHFMTIRSTVAEVSVHGQKERSRADLISNKTHSSVAFAG